MPFGDKEIVLCLASKSILGNVLTKPLPSLYCCFISHWIFGSLCVYILTLVVKQKNSNVLVAQPEATQLHPNLGPAKGYIKGVFGFGTK
jgi:hypothetical protein